jgi:hypothetical protein
MLLLVVELLIADMSIFTPAELLVYHSSKMESWDTVH